MKYGNLPHDGEIFIHISGKDFIKKLEKAIENVDNQEKEMINMAEKESKSIGLDGFFRMNFREAYVYNFSGYLKIPKSLKSYEKQDEWANKKIEKVYLKLKKINEKSKGSRKSYSIKKGFISSRDDLGNIFTIDINPMSDSVFRKNIIDPVKTVIEVFREDILGFKIDSIIEKNKFGSGQIMRGSYPKKDGDQWIGVIPIVRGEKQPESFKLPKGMKRFTMSQYWKFRENLEIKLENQ